MLRKGFAGVRATFDPRHVKKILRSIPYERAGQQRPLSEGARDVPGDQQAEAEARDGAEEESDRHGLSVP